MSVAILAVLSDSSGHRSLNHTEGLTPGRGLLFAQLATAQRDHEKTHFEHLPYICSQQVEKDSDSNLPTKLHERRHRGYVVCDNCTPYTKASVPVVGAVVVESHFYLQHTGITYRTALSTRKSAKDYARLRQDVLSLLTDFLPTEQQI